MEPLENERFEDAWRRAFEGAEEAPGEGLWGRIERQLPAERGKRRPVVVVGRRRLASADAVGRGPRLVGGSAKRRDRQPRGHDANRPG